jgi:DNA-directed RNA polymerase subunit omega
MARITVEDCLSVVPNRFSLVLVAAERTKQLLKTGQPLVENPDGNKEVVTALREIAANKFVIDDSAVKNEETWKPEHRKINVGGMVEEVTPEL